MKQRIITLVNSHTSSANTPRISLYGLGVTNTAVMSILLEVFRREDITVRLDGYDGTNRIPQGVHTIVGDAARNCIGEDVVFLSPSVRRENIISSEKTLLTSDMDIFLDDPPKNCFAISGSDGKSTVTAMCHMMLNSRFPNLFRGGNFGTPIVTVNLDSTDAFVIELSSFMLRYTNPGALRGVVTNITPNHLNWHKSMDEYVESKLTLLRSCKEAVINADDPIILQAALNIPTFTAVSCQYSHKELSKILCPEHTVTLEAGRLMVDGDAFINVSELQKKESHNIKNFMLATALSLNFAKRAEIIDVGRTFTGLEHRCEAFLVRDGITFINSSIDTTPERTKATLTGLNREVVIILGGNGKGISPGALEAPLSRYAKKIAIYGNYRHEIKLMIEKSELCAGIPHADFNSFEDAVEYAISELIAGDTLLLSPSATGYGQFRSYAQRGEYFKNYINKKYEKI